jgi:serpin B
MRGFAVTLLLWVMGTMSRADAPQGDSLMHEVVQGNNQFAIDIYARLRQQPGNLFLSPYSLSTALAMTYAGARGETTEQMVKVLHFDITPDRLHPAFEALIRQVNGGKGRSYRLSVANALWGQEGDPFLPEFLRLLADRYGAGLRRVDFRSTEQARRTINAWVEEQTGGKIKDLLKPPDLGRDTSLVLTNAIYFKGDWASPFPKGATRDETFTVTGDEQVPVPMMHRAGHFNYLDSGGFQALELPYAGDALSIVVLLPKRVDGLTEFEGGLSAKGLADWLAGLRPRRVDVALPRFRIEARFELKRVLSAMGMPVAFGGDADFSGINGKRDLFISAVIHQAFVDGNEEGTEAAAATAVVMGRAAAARPEPIVSFRADHPFVFLIRDICTESILFLGRVTSPRG